MPGNPSLTAFAGLGPPWSLSQLDANFTAVANLLKSVNNYATFSADTGGANAYAATFSAPLTFTLASGVAIIFKAANTNTGASTLAVNGGAATPIVNPNGSALLPGQIMAGSVVSVLYDGSNWILVGAALADGPINQVMNGTFNFLRDSSVTSHNPTASAVSYLAHRWYTYQVGGITGDMTVAQILGGPASDGALTNRNKMQYPYCMRVSRTLAAAITDARFSTVFPTFVTRTMTNKPLLLQFYARAGAGYSAASSILPVNIVTGTATDQSASAMEGGTWTGQATASTTNVTLTTSWQEFSVNIPALSTGVLQLGVQFKPTFVGAAPANDYFEVAGVRLSPVGATAAPIVELPPDQDFKRCLRFFELISSATPTDLGIAAGFFVTTTRAYFALTFFEKRSIPAITVSNVAHFYVSSSAANDVATSIVPAGLSTGLSSTRLVVDIGAARTAGQGVMFNGNGANARIYIDADF